VARKKSFYLTTTKGGWTHPITDNEPLWLVKKAFILQLQRVAVAQNIVKRSGNT